MIRPLLFNDPVGKFSLLPALYHFLQNSLAIIKEFLVLNII